MSLSAALLSMMKHQCSIQKSTITRDRGIETTTWSTTKSSVPCSVQPVPAEKRVEFNRLGIRLQYRFFFEPDIDLREDDFRIVFNSRRYLIRSVENGPIEAWPTIADCEEQFE